MRTRIHTGIVPPEFHGGSASLGTATQRPWHYTSEPITHSSGAGSAGRRNSRRPGTGVALSAPADIGTDRIPVCSSPSQEKERGQRVCAHTHTHTTEQTFAPHTDTANAVDSEQPPVSPAAVRCLAYTHTFAPIPAPHSGHTASHTPLCCVAKPASLALSLPPQKKQCAIHACATPSALSPLRRFISPPPTPSPHPYISLNPAPRITQDALSSTRVSSHACSVTTQTEPPPQKKRTKAANKEIAKNKNSVHAKKMCVRVLGFLFSCVCMCWCVWFVGSGPLAPLDTSEGGPP